MLLMLVVSKTVLWLSVMLTETKHAILCWDLIFLQKYVSLNQNTDFQRTYYRGKSTARPALVVYAMKNRVGICRVGITTSKKIGNAVERNRSRRIISAAYQSIFTQYALKGNYDIIFVARGKTKYLKSTQVEKAMLDCITELGLVEVWKSFF